MNAWKAWLADYQKAKMAYSTLVLDCDAMRSDEVAFSDINDKADTAQANLRVAEVDLLALKAANLAADIPGAAALIQAAEIRIKFLRSQVNTLTSDANYLNDVYIKARAVPGRGGLQYLTWEDMD